MVFLVKSHTFACKKSGSLTHLCMVKSQDVLPSCAHTWSSKAWSSEVPLLPLSADVVWNTLRGFWEATKKHWYGYVVYIYTYIYIHVSILYISNALNIQKIKDILVINQCGPCSDAKEGRIDPIFQSQYD